MVPNCNGLVFFIIFMKVFSLCVESPPDPRRPLDTCYDEMSDRLMNYNLEDAGDLSTDELSYAQPPPVIRTADMQRCMDYFTPWLDPENRQPFLLVGPDGCGKG